MKKLLILLFAVSTIFATSCKKDTETTPKSTAPIGVNVKELGTWD